MVDHGYPGIGFWDFTASDPGSVDVPAWADALYGLFETVRPLIDSRQIQLKSDEVLAAVRPGLIELGYDVEEPGHRVGFEAGRRAGYHVDAWHEGLSVVLEIEAVRAMLGGAFYRDVFRLLIAGRDLHGAIAVPLSGWRGNRAFDSCYRQSALLAGSKPTLPFKSLLLLGY